jgi:hypothetical protein
VSAERVRKTGSRTRQDQKKLYIIQFELIAIIRRFQDDISSRSLADGDKGSPRPVFSRTR